MATPRKRESGIDRIASILERMTRDVVERGTVTVLAVNEPAPRGRFQTCTIQARVEAKGFGPEEVELEYTLRRDHWPVVGAVLPADVHIEQPEHTEILWERVPKK